MNNYSLEDLKCGNFDPDTCFRFTEDIDVESTFSYPMHEFCKAGSWDINGKPAENSTEAEIAEAKTLLKSKLDKIYYIQEGEHDEQSWFILGKVGDNYVYFEAACDYTGFDCRGGGSFCYDENWKTLWNMGTTSSFRSLILFYYGVTNIEIAYDGRIDYQGKEYIKRKLNKSNND